MHSFKQWLLEYHHDEDDDRYDENGFWIGKNSSGGASGILPICSSTGRICLGWRSEEVSEGECWGVFGGAVPQGADPAKHAIVELRQETGYKGLIKKLIPAYIFRKGSFTYQNYLGIVPKEFIFKPSRDYAWETDFIKWMTLQEIMDDIRHRQHDFHSGVLDLFRHSHDLIAKYASGASTEAP